MKLNNRTREELEMLHEKVFELGYNSLLDFSESLDIHYSSVYRWFKGDIVAPRTEWVILNGLKEPKKKVKKWVVKNKIKD